MGIEREVDMSSTAITRESITCVRREKALLTAENTAIPDNWLNVRGSEMKKHITALTTAKATVHAAELDSVFSSFAPTRTWRAGWGVSIGMR